MDRRKKRKIIRNIQRFAVIITALLIIAGVIFGICGIYSTIKGFFEESNNSDYSDYSEFSTEEYSNQEDNQWYLILVNSENPLPQEFEISLAETENGHKVDERIKEPLEEMLADARNEGIIPKITSSYRTREEQQQLLDEKTEEYISQGMNQQEALEKAKEWVALPDTSEHQTGLAVDISTADWEDQDAYTVWAWLEKNCWKYGFILRYTEEHQSITGIIPEPWHFRYVGAEAAKEITERGICLEEYLA